jgi:hypothetical protein
MKLGLLKRIDRADLAKSGEVPGWVDALLETLNPFIEKVGLALQGRLTLPDNFLGKEIYTDFTHNTELEINPFNAGQNTLRAKGVILMSTGEVFVTAWKWRQKDNGNIAVTIQFSGATTAKVRLHILLG